jgi:cytochrome P450
MAGLAFKLPVSVMGDIVGVPPSETSFWRKRSPATSSAANQAVLPAYDLTARLAALESPEELAHALEHARRSPEATDRFLGVFAGSVPVEEFFPAALTAMPR